MKTVNKDHYLSILFIFISCASFASESQEKANEIPMYIDALLIPAIIAVFGYLLKILHQMVTERSKRKRELLEGKLKNFYWPILTRLEQNEAIWTLILRKRSELDDLKKKIAHYVEEHIVLKNHREIMSIITNNRYYAKFDKELSVELGKYFRHVAIYEGILEAKVIVFPGEIGAKYPNRFDELIKGKTESLQQQLDKK